jgi:cytoskeletal protein CcmA (bactofilin family)
MNEVKSGRPGTEKQTLVEEGTEFKGSLSSNCPIVIKGRLEGDVSGPSIQVSATGSVSGTVKAGEIKSEGELAGRYEADVVRLSGRVKDGTVIKAKTLEMRLAPPKGKLEITFGECELEVGDEPKREEAVETPAAATSASAPAPLPGITRTEAASEEAQSPKAEGKSTNGSKAAQPAAR